MLTAKLTSEGRITIPKQVRDALGLHAGGWLSFRVRGSGVFEMVVPFRDQVRPPLPEEAPAKAR